MARLDETKIQKFLNQGRMTGDEEWCYRINLWKCLTCSREDIYGFVKTCPGCGHGKDESGNGSEKLDPNSKYYTEELIDQLIEGAAHADWICEHCECTNNYTSKACDNCGASATEVYAEVVDYAADGGPASYEQATQEYKARQAAVEDGAYIDPFEDEFYGVTFSQPRMSGLRKVAYSAGAIALAGILIFFFYWLLFATHDVSARMQSVFWNRTVNIEKYTPQEEEDWSIPPGGKFVSQSQQVRSYSQVLDRYETKTREVRYQSGTKTSQYKCGTTKTGSGFSKDKYCTSSEPVYSTKTESYRDPVYRSVPVYATKYRYIVYKWLFARLVEANGISQEPFWPAVSLGFGERQGSRTEKYSALFIDAKGRQYDKVFNYEEWILLEHGKHYKLTLNNAGMILAVK